MSPDARGRDRRSVHAHGRRCSSPTKCRAGSGRTGTFLHSRTIGLDAGSVALGKALGGGVPIGAAMLSREVAATAAPGDHGTTYGGNLLACRAALVVPRRARGRPAGLDRARVGDICFRRCARWPRGTPARSLDVRGAGLMAGLDLNRDATAVVDRGARARAARQSHRDDRHSAAAAVHRDGRGHRRSDRHPGCRVVVELLTLGLGPDRR